MGTTFEVYLYAPDGPRAAELFVAAFAEVERVERLLSTYISTSELSRLNAHAAEAPVVTDPELFALLGRAFEISRWTDGAFDMTVGRLLHAWGFDRGSGHYPSRATVTAATARTGWRHVVLDSAARTVHFLEPGLLLDPGGIGKGYAVDRVSDLLRSQGVAAALIGAGTSSFYAIGAPPGTDGWAVRVRDPFGAAEPLSTVRLRDASLSTSGSYENYFVRDGRRYSHIIDPRTGEPVEGTLQVTVIAPLAIDSDALSTALFVLGAVDGRAVVEGASGTSVLFIEGSRATMTTATVGWPTSVRAGSSRQRSPKHHE